MKKSDQITSPASFLKKQSHIITNNVANPDYYHLTPTTRHDLYHKCDLVKRKCIVVTSIAKPTPPNSWRIHISISRMCWICIPRVRAKVMMIKMSVKKMICQEKLRSIIYNHSINPTSCLLNIKIVRPSRKRNLAYPTTIFQKKSSRECQVTVEEWQMESNF